MHLGKGQLAPVIAGLEEHCSVLAVIPPITALLGDNTIHSSGCISELGMEAFCELR